MNDFCILYLSRRNIILFVNCEWGVRAIFGVSGTIAPARELPDQDGPDSPLRLLLANLNLVVPVASALLVIIVAIIVMCFLRGKGNQHKGESVVVVYLSFFITGTIAPPHRGLPTIQQLFPWIPYWAVDLNIIVPIAATIVVIFVGIIVICVAFARRSRGPEQTRLRGDSLVGK